MVSPSISFRTTPCVALLLCVCEVHNTSLVLTCIQFSIVVYPVMLSGSTKAFLPHLVGIVGIYCRNQSQPLKPIISYSNLMPKIESCFEVGYEGVNKWSQLVQRVIAFGMYFVLSFRWRKRRRRENQSQLMIELNVAKGQDVTQQSSIDGKFISPVMVTRMRNLFSSAMSCTDRTHCCNHEWCDSS